MGLFWAAALRRLRLIHQPLSSNDWMAPLLHKLQLCERSSGPSRREPNANQGIRESGSRRHQTIWPLIKAANETHVSGVAPDASDPDATLSNQSRKKASKMIRKVPFCGFGGQAPGILLLSWPNDVLSGSGGQK